MTTAAFNAGAREDSRRLDGQSAALMGGKQVAKLPDHVGERRRVAMFAVFFVKLANC